LIFNNRKAGLLDLIIAIVLSFVLAISLVLFLYAQNSVEEILLEQAPAIQKSFENTTNVTQIIEDTVGNTTVAYASFKWISVMLIFGYFISIIVSSFIIRTHPAWFVGYAFIVVVSTVLSAYISNVYEVLMNDPTLKETFLTGFFGQNWIFMNLPVWVAVIGFLSGIVMYINLDTGESYG